MKSNEAVNLWSSRSDQRKALGQVSVQLTEKNDKALNLLLSKFPGNNRTQLINDLIDTGLKVIEIEKL